MKMYGLVLLAVSTALVITPDVLASPILGSISVSGVDTYTYPGEAGSPPLGISFTNPGVVLAANGTFASLLSDSAILDGFNFASGVGTELFNVNSGASTLTIDSLAVLQDTSSFLNISGTGLLTETGYTSEVINFTLTSTSSGLTTFTADASTTPEPSSLLLLGSGLLGLAMVVARKRKASGLVLHS